MNFFKRRIINRIAAFFKFPGSSVEMFGLAGELSGINKDNLPSELLPLNAVQLSRGLLNYTFLQSNMNWVFPFWAAEQYNPASKSFVPRSHLGLSMNVTNRNWTGIGNMNCAIEPIVDPRGMVTPFRDGWSIDTWLISKNNVLLPSAAKEINQKALDDLPAISTEISSGPDVLKTAAFTYSNELFVNAEMQSNAEDEKSIVFSIRPFNPEGVSPVYNILYDARENSLLINNKEKLFFESRPSMVYCSSFEEGDAFQHLNSKDSKYSAECKYGLASAAAVFPIKENIRKVRLKFSLSGEDLSSGFHLPEEAIVKWNKILSEGTLVETPDDKLNSLFKFSTSTLLMLIDDDSITPGPFTYHQFWIRDAAYMINALDKAGFSKFTESVIRSFKKYQDRKGFFRSQKGEWDSNGQVLWTVYQHAVYSGNVNLLEEIFDPLYKGVKWIDKFRLRNKKYEGKPFYGLLPPGLSAEHLGHVDYYFWDNFWSIAGLESFAGVCRILGKDNELKYVTEIIKDYEADIEKAVENVASKFSVNSIPASCSRSEDCGMIGSLAAAYPLQYYEKDNQKIKATLGTLYSKYFFEGMMFQDFIHSGMNAYLSLQTAHTYLYSGDREKFIEILNTVKSRASSTFTYPEAINPVTGGGGMGDGHHGWAAAEIVSAVRDAFVFERYKNSSSLQEIVLLQGIPAKWFEGCRQFSIKNAPVYNGKISIIVKPGEESVRINIDYEKRDEKLNVPLRISLPFLIGRINVNGREIEFINDDEGVFTLASGSCSITIIKKNADILSEKISANALNK